MTTDAYIRVICDGCEAEEEIPLTATAKGYDERNVAKSIEKLGWKTTGEDEHRCAECVAEEEQGK